MTVIIILRLEEGRKKLLL